MNYIIKLVLPSAVGLSLGIIFSGGTLDSAGLSNSFFFAAILNILYSGFLFAVDLGSFKTMSFGVGLAVKLIFNKGHSGGKKITDDYVDLSNKKIGAIHYWPQGAIGAAFLALSAIFIFL